MWPTNPQEDLKGGKGNERFFKTASERFLFWIFASRLAAIIYAMPSAVCALYFYGHDLRLAVKRVRGDEVSERKTNFTNHKSRVTIHGSSFTLCPMRYTLC